MTELIRDLRKAAAAWRGSLVVPVLTLLLSVIPAAAWAVVGWPTVELVIAPVLVLTAGFYGTQRIWYIRRFRGTDLSPAELLWLTWRFIGRFLTLGLLVSWPFNVFLVVYSLATLTHQGPVAKVIYFVVTLGFSLMIDFLLTFVTPALAYNTRSASRALELGVRMARRTWPRAAFYVFVPPLALQLLVFQPRGLIVFSWIVLLASNALAAMINLLFKGAVSAFYLREVPPVGDDGAAYAQHPAASAKPSALQAGSNIKLND